MKFNSIFLMLLLAFASEAHVPGQTCDHHDGPLKAIHFIDKQKEPDQVLQAKLRKSAPWQEFLFAANGHWNVVFNEMNGKPVTAFGSPVKISITASDEDIARYFFSKHLSGFNVPHGNLELKRASVSGKHRHVDFIQMHDGVEVINSRVAVRMNVEGEIIWFKMEYFEDITVNTTPTFPLSSVKDKLSSEMADVNHDFTVEGVKILAVPGTSHHEYRLVYEMFLNMHEKESFSRYYILADAHSGEIIYRQSLLQHLAPRQTADVDVYATVYTSNPSNPATIEPVRFAKVVIGSSTFYTDENGKLNIPLPQPVQATIYLQGKWSRVVSGNTSSVTPSMSITLSPGANFISFDNHSNINQRSAYYHVNKIHTYMQNLLPAFTGLDFDLETRVDRTDGSCNAFYNGISINFFASNSQCYTYAIFGDVVYHEYGHAISHEFYQYQGTLFRNGALGEGFSDIWAFAITEEPVLAKGARVNNPQSYIRRYDLNPKVYPRDISGQVHNDGEIIAGAFWHLAQNLGSMGQAMSLFAEAMYALPNGFQGEEGRIYRDILVDVLLADDNDGNITNGTPNDSAIIAAFALHGITMLTNSEIVHQEINYTNGWEGAELAVSLVVDFPAFLGDVKVFFKEQNETQWQSIIMQKGIGMDFSAQLPPYPPASIIAYYIQINDVNSISALVQPQGANNPNPNIPYFIMSGYYITHVDDFDNQSDWGIGAVDDDATTGHWVIGKPNPSYLDPANPTERNLVQTGTDHTTTWRNGNNSCAFTGNAPLGSGAGANDVDEGKTTLYSPYFDLSKHSNPAISYYRWFTNYQGANPGIDPFEVYITDDGVNWIEIENTTVSDRSWRKYAFRVLDHVSLTEQVQLKFIASDHIRPNLPSNGQSLVEAAIDDLFIYEEGDEPVSTKSNARNQLAVIVYPNPARGSFNLELSGVNLPEKASVGIFNVLGQLVHEYELELVHGTPARLGVDGISAGVYQLAIVVGNARVMHKIVIYH